MSDEQLLFRNASFMRHDSRPQLAEIPVSTGAVFAAEQGAGVRYKLLSGSAVMLQTGLYSPAFHRIRASSLPMEIQPILNTIKDLTERSQSIRGYL